MRPRAGQSHQKPRLINDFSRRTSALHVVVGVVGDGDGDDTFYRHNRVSIATTWPSNSSANRYRSSSTAPRTRTTSITAAHSMADPRAIAKCLAPSASVARPAPSAMLSGTEIAALRSCSRSSPYPRGIASPTAVATPQTRSSTCTHPAFENSACSHIGVWRPRLRRRRRRRQRSRLRQSMLDSLAKPPECSKN